MKAFQTTLFQMTLQSFSWTWSFTFIIFLWITGTDSRVGFGYRLGDHADFQVQFELGPQKETQAIGTGAANKRAVSSSDSFKAEKEAQREALKEQVRVVVKVVHGVLVITINFRQNKEVGFRTGLVN